MAPLKPKLWHKDKLYIAFVPQEVNSLVEDTNK